MNNVVTKRIICIHHPVPCLSINSTECILPPFPSRKEACGTSPEQLGLGLSRVAARVALVRTAIGVHALVVAKFGLRPAGEDAAFMVTLEVLPRVHFHVLL